MTKRKNATLGRKFRPSNADRYLGCPASVVAAQNLPAGETTFYADKGTAVHAVIENCINTGKDPSSYLGMLLGETDIQVDHAMIASAKFCLDYIKSQEFTTVTAEQVVALPWIKNPDGEETTGKVDFVGYNADFGILKVGDYKDGYQPVPADSAQFGCYLIALVLDDDAPYKDANQIFSVLVQPNSKNGPEIIEREWTKAELIALQNRVNLTVHAVREAKAEELTVGEYCEGSWCKFCPLAKASAGDKMCPKKLAELFKDEAGTEALTIAETPKLPAPSTMTREQRALVLSNRKKIAKWMDDVYEIELTNAIAGDVPPGMKLVEGKAKRREWLSNFSEEEIAFGVAEATGISKAQIFEAKIKTPAALKKVLKGKIPPELDEFMTPEAKSVELVADDDKRGSVDGSDLFESTS